MFGFRFVGVSLIWNGFNQGAEDIGQSGSSLTLTCCWTVSETLRFATINVCVKLLRKSSDLRCSSCIRKTVTVVMQIAGINEKFGLLEM